MRLVAGSFRGLVTTGLYLHDCSLSSLAASVLDPLNSTLKYLWLNGNDIVGLDSDLESVFSVLQHLRLGENPLRCDCSAVWLKRLFDKRPDVFRGATPPTCRLPDRLRGRAFNETTVDEFLCRAPQLTRVEVAANNTAGRLRCAATGQPVPTIYWIQPSGQATRYLHPDPDPDLQTSDADDETGFENEGTLSIDSFGSGSRLYGMYICIANNDAGNVTLTISVPASSDLPRPDMYFTSWPSSFLPSNVTSSSTPVGRVTPASTAVERDADVAATSSGHRHRPPSRSDQFTLSQLVVAVVVTHIVTLTIYVVLAAVFYWRRRCTVDELGRRRTHAVTRRVRHQRCSGSSRSSSLQYAAASTKLSSLPQSPSSDRDAAVCLNGLAVHREFFFDSAAAYRFRDGEYG